jgi:hypothetical protein
VPTHHPPSEDVVGSGLHGTEPSDEAAPSYPTAERREQWAQIDIVLRRLVQDVVEGRDAHGDSPAEADRVIRAIGRVCYVLAAAVLVWMVVRAVQR